MKLWLRDIDALEAPVADRVTVKGWARLGTSGAMVR
jgi:hypothetical protein